MSSKRCCVPQCVEVEGSYRVLHWFPNPDKDIARFRTWVHAIGGEILSLSNESIYKLRRVCHVHFEEKYCCRNNKISNIAVPTLRMPGPLSLSKFICTDRKPFREVENLTSASKGMHQVLHGFPNLERDKERFNTWLYAIGGDILSLENEHIFKYRRVCRSHFEDKYLCRNNKISNIAVPTLNIPAPLSLRRLTSVTRKPLQQILELPATSSGLISNFEHLPHKSMNIGKDIVQKENIVNKMAPILYKIDASPPANAVRILADILGLELDVRDIDFSTLEHKSPEHVKLNPMGTVPTLVDGDFVISESHATMKYLLSVYGEDKSESLYPSDVHTRALLDQAMFFNVGIFFIRLKVIVLPTIFGDLDGPTEKHKADIDEAYGIVEAYLADHEYIATDHLTIADLSVGATAISMQGLHKLDADKFPRTAAWLARLEAHPSFQKFVVPGSKILGEITNAAWEKNKK